MVQDGKMPASKCGTVGNVEEEAFNGKVLDCKMIEERRNI
jgi:hypothetical protein